MQRILVAFALSAAFAVAAPARGQAPAQPAQPPAAQQQAPQPQVQQPAYTQGRVVRVDPQGNSVVVRVGEGQTARELNYKMPVGAKVWGTDAKPLLEQARFQALKEGTPVWYRLGQGADVQTITEMRLHDPTIGQ